MICAAGIPGSGKSSVFQALASLVASSAAFLEPEENDKITPWPKAVSAREEYGYFGSISWFRAMRVPILYDAEKAASTGKTSFVDFYYDKLLHNYLGKDGLDWFFPRTDPYYPVVEKMAEYDYKYLPFADLVIFFRIQNNLWRNYCTKRGRNMDKEDTFEKQCFLLQEPMLAASQKYAEDFHKKLLIFEIQDLSPSENAKNLLRKLYNFL